MEINTGCRQTYYRGDKQFRDVFVLQKLICLKEGMNQSCHCVSHLLTNESDIITNRTAV